MLLLAFIGVEPPPQKNIKEGACDNDRRFEQLGRKHLWEGLFFGVALLVLCGCREIQNWKDKDV